jgi:hypothetical protein
VGRRELALERLASLDEKEGARQDTQALTALPLKNDQRSANPMSTPQRGIRTQAKTWVVISSTISAWLADDANRPTKDLTPNRPPSQSVRDGRLPCLGHMRRIELVSTHTSLHHPSMACLRRAAVLRFRGVVFLAALASLVAATPAWGRSSRTNYRKARDEAAKKACLVGDVATGIEILAESYVETRDPVHIHNQGRCYQQNGQPEKAISRFEEYLRKATDLSADDRAVVERYIAECQAKLGHTAAPGGSPQPAQTETTPPPVELVRPAPPPPQPPIETVQRQPAGAVVPQPAPVTGSPGRGMRIGGVAIAGVGVVGLGLGVAFNIMERNLHQKMATDPSKNNKTNENARVSYQTISIVGYAAGGVALVTGVTMYLIGKRKESAAQAPIALVPVCGTGQASLVLTGRF